MLKPDLSVQKHFAQLEDPRIERSRLHDFHEILTIAVCAAVCGVYEWVDVEQFAKEKRAWFEGFLELKGGIPSHDTFTRLFRRLDPKAFAEGLQSWAAALYVHIPKEVIALDGKVLRGSFTGADRNSATRTVCAFATQNRLVLAHLGAGKRKHNEPQAFRDILEILSIEGTIVTIDAQGCRRDIAQKIIDNKADYVLRLKKSEPTLFNEVEVLFEVQEACDFENVSHVRLEDEQVGHDRLERRTYDLIFKTDALPSKKAWPKLNSVVRLRTERVENKKTTVEVSYCISSLRKKDAAFLAHASRRHWGIENGLHWCLDVQFREDDSRVRAGHGAENLATLRRLAFNLIKQDPAKGSLKGKQFKALLNDDYRERILGNPGKAKKLNKKPRKLG